MAATARDDATAAPSTRGSRDAVVATAVVATLVSCVGWLFLRARFGGEVPFNGVWAAALVGGVLVRRDAWERKFSIDAPIVGAVALVALAPVMGLIAQVALNESAPRPGDDIRCGTGLFGAFLLGPWLLPTPIYVGHRVALAVPRFLERRFFEPLLMALAIVGTVGCAVLSLASMVAAHTRPEPDRWRDSLRLVETVGPERWATVTKTAADGSPEVEATVSVGAASLTRRCRPQHFCFVHLTSASPHWGFSMDRDATLRVLRDPKLGIELIGPDDARSSREVVVVDAAGAPMGLSIDTLRGALAPPRGWIVDGWIASLVAAALVASARRRSTWPAHASVHAARFVGGELVLDDGTVVPCAPPRDAQPMGPMSVLLQRRDMETYRDARIERVLELFPCAPSDVPDRLHARRCADLALAFAAALLGSAPLVTSAMHGMVL